MVDVMVLPMKALLLISLSVFHVKDGIMQFSL